MTSRGVRRGASYLSPRAGAGSEKMQRSPWRSAHHRPHSSACTSASTSSASSISPERGRSPRAAYRPATASVAGCGGRAGAARFRARRAAAAPLRPRRAPRARTGTSGRKHARRPSRSIGWSPAAGRPPGGCRQVLAVAMPFPSPLRRASRRQPERSPANVRRGAPRRGPAPAEGLDARHLVPQPTHHPRHAALSPGTSRGARRRTSAPARPRTFFRRTCACACESRCGRCSPRPPRRRP
jgi:hypothetical protein